MAITNDMLLRTLQFIKSAYKDEIKDKSFLMLGKQEMHLHEAMLAVLEESGLIDDKSRFGEEELEDSVLFFKAFGFKEVHALDVSDYEHADIVFNLNDNLPLDLEEKFDIVFDGGVIEHVFNVANALLNICRLVKVDGFIININPVSNYIHNTFWNISPEMFLDFYSANDYKILDCSMFTFLSEDREDRAWFDRPVIWSPDVRLMNFIDVLYAGQHLRMMNRLCSNPHPHTWIIAQKTHSREFRYPIVSGYAAKHRGEQEDHTKRTMHIREKYDVSKVVQWVNKKEKVNLYCAGKDYKQIMKALYDHSLESRVDNVFDDDVDKLGACVMGKSVNYLNGNTYSNKDVVLICSEKYAQKVYGQLCKRGVDSDRIYKLTDSIFARDASCQKEPV